MAIWVMLVIPVPNISLQPAVPDAESMQNEAIGRTIEQIVVDIKANPNWIANQNYARLFAALMGEKDFLTQASKY